MAFPQIIDADTQSGTVRSNSTTWMLTWPTNLQSGDLVLGFIASDGVSDPAGSTIQQFPNGHSPESSAGVLTFFKRKSDGTETGTFTVTFANGEQGAWRIFRITGWSGVLGTNTVFTNFVAEDGDVVAEVRHSGSSQFPDPPSVDPLNWGTEDTLWLAACAVDRSRTISAFPLIDHQTADVSGGNNGQTLGVCTANSATSSLNPSTFTISASDDWACVTIAVRPASS